MSHFVLLSSFTFCSNLFRADFSARCSEAPAHSPSISAMLACSNGVKRSQGQGQKACSSKLKMWSYAPVVLVLCVQP